VADITNGRLIDLCPQPPSEYCHENVFVGASFMIHLEAAAASERKDHGNFMWGSDYLHPEGTFHHPDDWSSTPKTHESLQFAFGGLPEDHIRSMLGGTLIEVYRLDRAELVDGAARINAPSMDLFDKAVPIPSDARGTAYRTRAPGTDPGSAGARSRCVREGFRSNQPGARLDNLRTGAHDDCAAC
jgi:hypothetical protein